MSKARYIFIYGNVGGERIWDAIDQCEHNVYVVLKPITQTFDSKKSFEKMGNLKTRQPTYIYCELDTAHVEDLCQKSRECKPDENVCVIYPGTRPRESGESKADALTKMPTIIFAADRDRVSKLQEFINYGYEENLQPVAAPVAQPRSTNEKSSCWTDCWSLLWGRSGYEAILDHEPTPTNKRSGDHKR